MRRPAPARLRELRLGPASHASSSPAGVTVAQKLQQQQQQPSSSSSSKSFFSRVPLLHSVSGDGDCVQDWTVGDQVPGLLIPFAFLSSLRTNLQIATIDEVQSPGPLSIINPASPRGGPTLPVSESKFPIDRVPAHPKPYEPYVERNEPSDNAENDRACSGCSVTTFFAKKDADVAAALRLIGDSVTQQRQTAVKTIVFNPCILAISILVFLTSLKMLYTGSPSDLVLMMAVWVGYSLPGLLMVRYLVRGYHDVAQRVGRWSWLTENSVSGASHKRDEVLVAQHDNEIVGVLVLRMAKTVTGVGTPGVPVGGIRSRRKSSARWTGIIRAWTVRECDRGQGIGTRLLDEAVSNCRLRSFDGPILAEDHANATTVLPRVFNSVFEKQDAWARSVLELAIVGQRGG